MNKLLKSFLLLLVPLSLVGQVTPVTNQYVLNPVIINPAYSGTSGALSLAAFYRKQWIGIDGSPETMTLAMDAPLLDAKIGVGFIITNDKIGVTKETKFSAAYAYRIRTREGFLSFGLGAGLITTNTAWSNLVVLDPGDEDYLIDSRVFVVPDFNFGAYYTYQNFFAGLSIPNLIGYKFDFDENKYALNFDMGQYYYLLNTGYIFNISPIIKFYPSTLLTFSKGEKLIYDINTHFILFDRLWIGSSYRNKRSVVVLVQFAITNQLKIAHTYDIEFGKLGRYSNGSHEIMLRYEFRYKVNALNPLVF